ncbi:MULTISPECIES: four helix bundle protein [unclassified Flavobacterium]|jgi:four helix bundle protein|uniref:four helix bundle protein n=1 Tax=unclassified Flavobacterium TaxID=196869 RepID=UPI0018EF2331|nr:MULTISPECIES: four helix bundle protein [unclassified Flavobacterium]
MRDNVIKTKSFLFALEIIKISKSLMENKREYVLSKQVLRSGTSIGAMVRESEHAESKNDFIHKLSIALKEANETEYWLLLLRESQYLTPDETENILKSILEIIKLLTSIIKTSKTNR